jgi:ribosome-binding protein aMBF1 (putative translation factor)
MEWTATHIQTLRLGLGWSRADFSRRLGCAVETIEEWEKGRLSPTADDARQLERLIFYLDTYSEVIERQAQAEPHLRDLQLEQIHRTELKR